MDIVQPSSDLSSLLREGTREQHARAERSGFVADLLRGRGGRDGYALFLRNLVPAYTALERGLERHRASPLFQAIDWPALYRADALARDLAALAGAGWADALALLPEGGRYADRVAAAGDGDGHRLLAHAYTRYLGDLSGGQVVVRLVGRSLGLGADALAFYRFPGIADPDTFKAGFRRALDAAGRRIDPAAVLDEAIRAFELNIALSEAVQRADRAPER
ncbi:MAG: biliverdin-producing heme oxygenase [Proteobacteria bacterium]|nr:biliverdin-producing heme oxygenase [Pseudomonadota bacterium]